MKHTSNTSDNVAESLQANSYPSNENMNHVAIPSAPKKSPVQVSSEEFREFVNKKYAKTKEQQLDHNRASPTTPSAPAKSPVQVSSESFREYVNKKYAK